MVARALRPEDRKDLMNLFETLDDLKPFIFRITDNGGESADRFTVATTDGDYYAMSADPYHPQGVGMTGEGYDPNGGQSRIDDRVERDIRWIDLPRDCQRCVMNGLNRGFSDWLGTFIPPPSRDGTVANGTAMRLAERVGEGVYGADGAYFVKLEDCGRGADDDRGPYPTVREAVLASLPDEHDLSGEEFHSSIDMWSIEGGPRPLWDRTKEPPVLELHNEHANYVLKDPEGNRIGWFASDWDAKSHLDNLEEAFHQFDAEGDFPKRAHVIMKIEKDVH